ncbi:MAG: MmgE/PrpD family protein [Spirochaetaceae bacterium]|nr:MAG: MmgE/PrpD family protein [Spirochaetaceae bacterium]
MDGDSQVARFIAEATWDALPAEVQKKAKMCLMDNLSATISGARTRVSRIATEFASTRMPGEEATILLHGSKATTAGAAFANASAANGLDTDDSARYSYGHAGAQLFPTALAVTEARALSGADLLSGLVVGYEVAHRMGRCWHDHHENYQACGSWGSVACAAVAAHLMKLDVNQAKNTIGIAEYHAPNLPMMRDIARPAMVKHGIGWGALTGITAAELAFLGFTGIPTLFSFDKYREWVEDIGRHYIMVDGVAWKAKDYACCGWAHAAVEGSKKLADEHHIDFKAIDRIIVETFKESAALGTRLPTTTEEAQFNLSWPVAAMLVDGEIGPEQTLEHRLQDETIRGLAAKVEVRESEELNELCRLFSIGDPRGRFASSVTVVLNDGRQLESGLVGGGLVFPQSGWDEHTMEEKFHWLVDPLLGRGRAEKLIDLVWSFEKQTGVDGLIAEVRLPEVRLPEVRLPEARSR